jgi:phosphatidate cytidylyltransferase
VVAIALVIGGWAMAVFMAVAFAVIYREWEQMVTLQPLGRLGIVLLVLLVLSALIFPMFGAAGTAVVGLVAAVISAFGSRPPAPWRVGGLLFFTAVILGALSMRGNDQAGALASWFLGIVIALNDTGAYFIGRMIGGAKLAPSISPGKTRAGSLGGLLVGIASGMIFWLVFTTSPWWIGLILSAGLGIVGQAGDLTESAVKRVFRVKDTGDVIPGHGGFMDRLDSVSFGVLFLFVVGALHGGLAHVGAGFLFW